MTLSFSTRRTYHAIAREPIARWLVSRHGLGYRGIALEGAQPTWVERALVG